MTCILLLRSRTLYTVVLFALYYASYAEAQACVIANTRSGAAAGLQACPENSAGSFTQTLGTNNNGQAAPRSSIGNNFIPSGNQAVTVGAGRSPSANTGSPRPLPDDATLNHGSDAVAATGGPAIPPTSTGGLGDRGPAPTSPAVNPPSRSTSMTDSIIQNVPQTSTASAVTIGPGPSPVRIDHSQHSDRTAGGAHVTIGPGPPPGRNGNSQDVVRTSDRVHETTRPGPPPGQDDRSHQEGSTRSDARVISRPSSLADRVGGGEHVTIGPGPPPGRNDNSHQEGNTGTDARVTGRPSSSADRVGGGEHVTIGPGPPPGRNDNSQHNDGTGAGAHVTIGPGPGPPPGRGGGGDLHITIGPGPPPGQDHGNHDNNSEGGHNDNKSREGDDNNKSGGKNDRSKSRDEDNEKKTHGSDDSNQQSHKAPSKTPPPGPPPSAGTVATQSVSKSCETKTAAPKCTEMISAFRTSGMTTTSTITRTTCTTITECDARATTTTTTTTTSDQGHGPTGIADPLDWTGNAHFFEAQQKYLAALSEDSGPDATYSSTVSSLIGKATPSVRVPPGRSIAPGTELRILPLGDSITYGWLSTDGNGYRKDCSMIFTAGWPGKTIDFIAKHALPSLDQGPNIILLHAGTNDLLPENSDPQTAVRRLAGLIDQIVKARPKAVLLVAQLIHADNQATVPGQDARIMKYDSLIPAIVQSRADKGLHVLTVDFRSINASFLRPGDVHPSDEGYRKMGDIWYDAMRGIPEGWIKPPIGRAPVRSVHETADLSANGGPDPAIPDPKIGPNVVESTSPAHVSSAARAANAFHPISCRPVWFDTGKISQGLGHNGEWRYRKNWISGGKVAEGLHRNPASSVQLKDMNGDGKADYLWIDPENGELNCWLNHLPGAWSPAGTNSGDRKGIIASGAGRGEQVFLADMNGDGKADYLVVDAHTGSVTVYWNEGPDASADNGWRFNPGGKIATGVPHANLATLRFADMNGDGRADYVTIGQRGSLGLWLNIGQPGSYKVLFEAQGGIASGVTSHFSNILLEDIDGDGRSDYLTWDKEGGLTGFLNIPTRTEGVNYFANQGGAKVIADGIDQDPDYLRLADLDGDGKNDYCYIDDAGAIWVWWNKGFADTSLAMDSIRFADMTGDGADDIVSIDPATGAATLYMNVGPSGKDSLGWQWVPADPPVIATGAGPGPLVHLADITGNRRDDYLVVDATSGAVELFINILPDRSFKNLPYFRPFGQIATGTGPGKNVRFADIDGDGKDDYIYLGPRGEFTVYRSQFNWNQSATQFLEDTGAGGSGIGQRPEDITFSDIDGDGRADLIYTRVTDGAAFVWKNNYPRQPTWLPPKGPIHQGVGVSGRTIRYADITRSGRSSYIALDPNTGAAAAWLNGCNQRAHNRACYSEPATFARKGSIRECNHA